MTHRPSISILIPAYNAAPYLEAAVRSLQAQCYTDWEAVIADDCSTDATSEIASRLAKEDPRVRVIKLEKNSGTVFEPRRRAALAARGRYVLALDADDLLEPDYLQKMLSRAEASGASMVCPAMWSFSGNPHEAKPYCPAPDFDYSLTAPGRELVRLTLDGWEIGCGGCLYDADLYRDVIRRHDDGDRSPFVDEVFTRFFLLASEIVAFSDARYLYRVNPDSITRGANLRQFHFLHNDLLLNEIIAREFSYESEERKRMDAQLFNHYIDYLRLLSSLSGENFNKGKELLEANYSALDFERLKGNPRVSPRLLHIAARGVMRGSAMLACYDVVRRFFRRR